MKAILLKVLSFLTHPIRFCSTGAVIVGSRLRIQKDNVLQLNHTHIKKSRISVFGSMNNLKLGKADIHNSEIMVLGNNCQLIINHRAQIYNLHLFIKSDNCTVSIGSGTSFGGGTIVCSGKGNSIRFGSECMIAEGVNIWNSDTHTITVKGVDLVSYKPIVIRDHVWLGKDVTILKGVNIGENAIVGMKSLVTHDICPGTINAGIPARELQKDANWRN